MAELTKKTQIRAGHRGVVTKRIRETDEVIDTATPDRPLNKAKLAQLKLSLKEKLETLSRLDDEIVGLIEKAEDLETEMNNADDFKQGIYTALVKIDAHLNPSASATVTVGPSATSTMTGPTSLPVSRSSTAKLPKLHLPSFDGDLTKWLTFWDAFKAAVHENSSLSDVEKFSHLRALVQRSAHDAISGLTLSSANYNEAITILQKRFGNKEQIISKHMDALLYLEPVTAAHNVPALRRLHDQVESHMRGLKSLGTDSGTYGKLLLPLFIKKLPAELRLIISRQVAEGEWAMEKVMEALDEELKARERTAQSAREPSHRSAKEASQPTVTTFMTSNPGSLTCCYCNHGHSSHTCQVVTRPEARKLILRKSGRCFICLRKGHLGRECRSRMRCTVCNGRHHVTICERALKGQNDGTVIPQNPHTNHEKKHDPVTANTRATPHLNPSAPPFGPTDHSSSTLCAYAGREVLLQTAQATVFNLHDPDQRMKVRLILDSGSQCSYITHQSKELLQLKTLSRKTLSIMTFGSHERKRQECHVVRIGIQLKDGRDKELQLMSVPFICEPLRIPPIQSYTTGYLHSPNLDLADSFEEERVFQPDILVGSDHYWDLVTGETLRGEDGPVAMYTHLGWVLSGPVSKPDPTVCHTNFAMTHVLRVDVEPDTLEDRLRAFWELESMGVQPEEKVASTEVEINIEFRGGRYEVSLPWKEFHQTLPDNYELCRLRLRSLMRRLKQNPALLQEYDRIIQDQIQKGIVEDVPEVKTSSVCSHYLPHHAIVRHNKDTSKVRVVYDASTRVNNCPSLNDCLQVGPKYNQRILDLLIRFRWYKTALIADIEKAFLMVGVRERDRDALRFLWVSDIDEEHLKIRPLRFRRVMFGVCSSPFLLNSTIQHHLEQYRSTYPDLIERLFISFYVDDLITGASNEAEVLQMYTEVKKIMKEGAFNLRKFHTNNSHLQQKINTEEERNAAGKDACTLSTPHNDELKVLGVIWDAERDKLVIGLKEASQFAVQGLPTKRHVVGTIGRFYDPLGIMTPVTVQFKILLRELFQAKLPWDQPLSGRLLARWNTLVDDLQHCQPQCVPRCYMEEAEKTPSSCQLVGFCDASTAAYAAVVYLLLDTVTGDRSTQFVTSKTRVSPIQKQTIPRLELLSALLLARLMSRVSEILKPVTALQPPLCYTDSEVARYWIVGTNKIWKPFVQNRVLEIRTLIPDTQWKHCAGDSNPADLPSRGISSSELATNNLWLKGPTWLLHHDQVNSPALPMPEACVRELKTKDQEMIVHGLLTIEGSGVSEIMALENFSSLARLYRVTALVLKFIEKLMQPRTTVSTLSLLSRVESMWIKVSQVHLTTDRLFKTWQRQLGLFLDSSAIWRCGGRITEASVAYTVKHPILLPRQHHFTTLVVLRAHERVFHDGVKETLVELRNKFWIIKGRSFVRQIIRHCAVCRRFEGQPYKAPSPPPLPHFRVQEQHPFTYTGLDYAGPLFVKPVGQCKDSNVKVWICLFTCCIVRAIHLELVPTLSTQSFIRCFKRFSARRGVPKLIVSDNGKAFKGAAKILKAIVSHPDVQRHVSDLGIEWRFNIERAPWWGGIFERLIKSTKRCLRKTIGRAALSYDELHTIITEVEAVVNSRPISYLSAQDLEEPLTPSHLMLGRRLLSLPDNLFYGNEEEYNPKPDKELWTKRLQYLDVTLNKFWKRWRNEYLIELRQIHQYYPKPKGQDNILVGDIVVVHSEDKPRGFWSLGRIEETIPGRDGEIRGAIVRVGGKKNSKTLRRPVQRLYPIETSSESPETQTTSGPDTETQTAPEPDKEIRTVQESVRPRRAAGLIARDRIAAQALDDS